jgi:circadian clock protein KaiC
MRNGEKVAIRRLSTGIVELDDVLGGGFPEYSFNLIAGDPGAGKTTLCHQIMFANATEERPALFFTILGEPPLKMLRYQQQYAFFDMAKIDRSIYFVNLTDQAIDDLAAAFEVIVREVERLNPAIVVVDSFRSLTRKTAGRDGDSRMGVDAFLERLTVRLTSWQATTFLVGNTPPSRPASIPCSPWPTAFSGSRKASSATPWCASSRPSRCVDRRYSRACTPSASRMRDFACSRGWSSRSSGRKGARSRG